MRLFSRWLLILLLASLAACGFQLRGSGSYSLDVQSVHIRSGASNREMAEELQNLFASMDVAVVGASAAQYIIDITGERTTRRPVASSGDITVSEYELTLTTGFSVTGRDGTEVIPATQLSAEKIYSFDRSSFVGNTEEEALLTDEMRRDLAGQVVRRISAVLRQEPVPR